LAEPLRVEAPSVDLAHALMERLHAFPTELDEGDRSCEVLVSLVGNPDRAVVNVLNSSSTTSTWCASTWTSASTR
jgi:hypothetical protein